MSERGRLNPSEPFRGPFEVHSAAIAEPPRPAPPASPPGPLSVAAWALFFGFELALAWQPFLPALGGDPDAALRPGVLDDPQAVAVAIAASWMSFLVAVALAWRARLTRRDVGWAPVRPRRLAGWTAVTLGGLLATWIAAGALFGDRLHVVEPLTQAPQGAGGWALWVALAWTSGVTEEFAARGYGIGLLVRLGADRWLAAAGMSVLFGMLHIYEGPHAVPLLAIWGFLFALAYLRTGSLLPGILAHAIVNSVAPLFIR